MGTIKRDTEPCVFLRFQVNEERMSAFMKMFSKATGTPALTALRGISKESGDLNLVFSFQPTGTGDAARRELATRLNSVFTKLFDFYPAISEKPSEIHESTALAFIRNAKTGSTTNTPAAQELISA